MNQENTNNKTIKLIVGAVILVGLVIFFSKDSIMYGYYVNKGDKEVESWKAVQDYTDALKIKYDDLQVDKIKLKSSLIKENKGIDRRKSGIWYFVMKKEQCQFYARNGIARYTVKLRRRFRLFLF